MTAPVKPPVTSLAIERGRAGVATDLSGSITCDGPDAVNLYRLLSLRSAMRLELRCPGMRVSRGRSVFAIARQEHDIKARTKLATYRAFCERHGFEVDL